MGFFKLKITKTFKVTSEITLNTNSDLSNPNKKKAINPSIKEVENYLFNDFNK